MKKQIKPNHVWAVELWDVHYGWALYTACGISKEQRERFLRTCRKDHPNDKFRLSKYVSEAK